MHLFYCQNIIGDSYILNPEESKHCKVLRIKNGDIIYITDGNGTLFKAVIQTSKSYEYIANIIDKKYHFNQRPYKLHIAISPTKNADRFEWFVEKATEIGIDEITPLICNRSEKKHLKSERLEKIAIAAMKQSFSTFLPKINAEKNFDHFIVQNNPMEKFIALCNDPHAKHLINTVKKNTNTLILIGPEGDFDQTEISSAKKNGFISISLGKNRLRTETAGIVACNIVNIINS